MNQLRILSATDIAAALPMNQAIAGMKEAFAQLSTGQADVPLRNRIAVPDQQGVALFMPAFMRATADLAIKVVSVFPHNAARGEPIIYATVLVLDATNGRPLALLEGSTLTAIRTGAGGGASADLLARPDAHIVAILGSGVQARAGLEAVCTVRDIHSVRVYSPNPDHAGHFAQEMAGRGPIPRNIQVAADAATAVHNADIIYTATTSSTPTFNGADVKPGAHIIGVGSYTPQMQEVDETAVLNATVIVDSRSAAWEEAGDLIIPLNQGLITPSHIAAELGEIVAGHKPGRTSDSQITFFKSVGVAVQDAVAARIALQNATAQNLGTVVEV
jgi:ornithine cyclodeaminase/alanine dehydrogenase-like protein (mu-crystallin family)